MGKYKFAFQNHEDESIYIMIYSYTENKTVRLISADIKIYRDHIQDELLNICKEIQKYMLHKYGKVGINNTTTEFFIVNLEDTDTIGLSEEFDEWAYENNLNLHHNEHIPWLDNSSTKVNYYSILQY